MDLCFDEKGYKMSKSLGNVVDPLKMMEQYGADIIRLWVMLSDYNEDIPDREGHNQEYERSVSPDAQYVAVFAGGFGRVYG